MDIGARNTERKREMTDKQRQPAKGNDTADELAKLGVDRDGALVQEFVAKDVDFLHGEDLCG